MGLSTARLLQRRGWQVTIYARDLPPTTTSNVAVGQWAPSSVFEGDAVTPAFIDQFTRASRFAYREFQHLVGSEYGVRWLDNYFPQDEPPPPLEPMSLPSLLPEVFANSVLLEGREHPFAPHYCFRVALMQIEPATYLAALLRDARGWFGFLAGSFLSFGVEKLLTRFHPRRKRYVDFKAALWEWKARTREEEEQARKRREEARKERERPRREFWRSLSGHAFERELAALFERQGYHAEVTPGSGDQGVDIILRRSGRTTVVQCKQTKNRVSRPWNSPPHHAVPRKNYRRPGRPITGCSIRAAKACTNPHSRAFILQTTTELKAAARRSTSVIGSIDRTVSRTAPTRPSGGVEVRMTNGITRSLGSGAPLRQ